MNTPFLNLSLLKLVMLTPRAYTNKQRVGVNSLVSLKSHLSSKAKKPMTSSGTLSLIYFKYYSLLIMYIGVYVPLLDVVWDSHPHQL